MSHDSTDPHEHTGGPSSQGMFIGWLGAGLIGLMALFTLVLFVAAARMGFS